MLSQSHGRQYKQTYNELTMSWRRWLRAAAAASRGREACAPSTTHHLNFVHMMGRAKLNACAAVQQAGAGNLCAPVARFERGSQELT